MRPVRQHFAAVRAGLDATGVRYTLVPTLVRGLDYYSRTTFELIGPDGDQNSTITGGGRYDYLDRGLGGRPTPGIGFGAGIERLLIARRRRASRATAGRGDRCLLRSRGRCAPRDRVARWLAELRRGGVAAETDYAGRSLKGQLTQAPTTGRVAATVVVGAHAATLREVGGPTSPVDHAEIVSRLSA